MNPVFIAAMCSPRSRRVAPVGGLTALQDWTNRSTAAGVVQAIRFNTDANVTNYLHADGNQGSGSRNATGGIIGDGSLRIAVAGSAGSSALWRAPLNSSWATDNQGFGATEFYVQFRKKNGLNSLTPSTNGGGFKIINLSEYKPTSPNSSRGHAGNEIVLNNQNWRGILFAYRELSPGGQIGLDEQIGADIYLQPAVDHGAGVSDPFARYCLYQSGDASAGCWFLQEEAWFTICMRVKIPSYGGSAGNEFDVWVARAGETSYTHLFNNRNFAIDYDPILTNGVNGAWFSAYDTNRTGASYDTYHEFDQLIVSTQPIACPLI